MIVNRGSRGRDIYQMREAGETYKSIADKWGISTERARQIYLKVKRQLDADKESVEEYGVKLSPLTLKILHSYGISGSTSRQEAIKMLRGIEAGYMTRVNKKCLREIESLLSIKCEWVQDGCLYRLRVKEGKSVNAWLRELALK